MVLVVEPSTARLVHLLFDLWPGYDAYVSHYASIARRNACGSRINAGAKVVGGACTTEAEMAWSEFYQPSLAPRDMGYVRATILSNDRHSAAAITSQRARSQGPFEPHELEILDRLAPHLTRALRVQTRFAALEAERRADHALRDRLPFATVLVDERGRIVSQNRAATDLLATDDGLTARHGCLRTTHAVDQVALDELIRAAATPTKGAGAPAGGALPLRRPSLRRALHVLAMPIPPRGCAVPLDIGAPAPVALVIIADPDAVAPAPAAVLQRLHGLTPAEAELARALAAGRTLQEYAEAAQVTCETARWRLKQVLAKTSTRRQAELVRLVLTSPMLGDGAPSQTGGAAAVAASQDR